MAACRLLRSSLARSGRQLRFQRVLPCLEDRRAIRWRHSWSSDSERPDVSTRYSRTPGFGFVFDIDGVLLRSNDPIPGAREALTHLREEKVPFMLLTNGGGKTEVDRVAELNEKLALEAPIGIDEFVQSHTPFQELAEKYKDSTVLVVGGDDDKCRHVAESYGFKSVVVPADIFCANPDIWPFSRHLVSHYERFARPLPRPIYPAAQAEKALKFDAIFVYNDPRDWGLDATIMADVLLSDKGVLGIPEQPKNGAPLHPESPCIYWSNSDVLWAARYPLPRIGQGGFRSAFSGMFESMLSANHCPDRVTNERLFGKPHAVTMQYCEKRVLDLHGRMYDPDDSGLRNIYMVGDNPRSDIEGANRRTQQSSSVNWTGILVETGVYSGGQLTPIGTPGHISSSVLGAVRWALAKEGWPDQHTPLPPKSKRFRVNRTEKPVAVPD